MNDRELLEQAANAAGDVSFDGFTFIQRSRYSANVWQPMHDDGDAFRLAVKLHLSLTLNSFGVGVGGVDANMRQVFERVKAGEGGLEAATRLAIVRAAAAIGAAL